VRQGRDNGFLLTDEQKVLAINLGADYCAEHEWGIKGINQAFGFGLNDSKLGLERRQVTGTPLVLWLDKIPFKRYNSKTRKNETLKFSGFMFHSYYKEQDEDVKDMLTRQAYPGENNIVSMWDEQGFAVLCGNEGDIASLKEIYDSFSKKDIAIWRGGGGVFKNAGLVIAIASRLPKEVTDNWYQADADNKKIKEEVLAMGIEAKLRKAGKGYFALSPRRQGDGSIKFWLNPTEQDKNNHGWYDLKDLEEWAENRGPIPKG
jgi:hypothetical protein